MKKEKRFEVVLRDGSQKIIVDKETGVQYLVWQGGYAGGITPLLDKDGKPIISK